MKPQASDKKGQFIRPETQFRNWIRKNGTTPFLPEANRYHLYVSWACPWAHRTLITRKLRGLETIISFSAVDAHMDSRGWHFSNKGDAIPDTVNHANFLSEIYQKANSSYQGRWTVPVLWDKKQNTIVNNESREIMRMFNEDFTDFSTPSPDLCPKDLKPKIDEVLDTIYEPINNGVYKAGFATKQAAYDDAVTILFDALNKWEAVLSKQRFTCGNYMTEADIALFTTLFRFDLVYITHFKCNLKRLVDFPNLWGFVRDMYQTPGVSETCKIDHIKTHYFSSHKSVNPLGIVAKGPIIDFNERHQREVIS